ncbi:CIC_collapsed_G0005960.mRNA.1.CDS.1 [Saccharomyces cerevisiae]|nr:CIC_collapsed_G0005960.mRNA.1.CDS.1 [Saccharomyces cerevisiae]
MGITVIGSLNYDLDTFTDRLPNAGETFRANHFETHAGGKGLNQAAAIGKLKNPSSRYSVRMIGNVGNDTFGKQLKDTLSDCGVDITRVGTYEGINTGTATILIEEKAGGQNRILIVEGANSKTIYDPKQLCEIFPEGKEEEEYVVFQHEIPDPLSIIKWIHANRPNFQIVYNPSPFKTMPKKDWELVDLLVVNEIEGLQIVESVFDNELVEEIREKIKDDFLGEYRKICELLYEKLMNRKKRGIVVMTLGSRGVLFCSHESPEVQFLPAIQNVSVVDTTGAGDTFLGGLVTQLYQGETLSMAIKFSTLASSLTIQRKGAAESMPLYKDVQKDA